MSMIQDINVMRNDPRRGFKIHYETQTSCDMMMPEDMSDSELSQGTTSSSTTSTSPAPVAASVNNMLSTPSPNMQYPTLASNDILLMNTRSPSAVNFPYPGAEFLRTSDKKKSKKPKKY